MSFILWSLAGYLAGSCPTGFLVAKFLRNSDIRSFGSGNIGATNVGRLMGKKWAVAVALFDMLKGGLAVLIASFFTESPEILASVGFCAVLGHNYPFWLGFRGGKGVATSFGVIAFYGVAGEPYLSCLSFPFSIPELMLPALLGGLVWLLVMKATRYVSEASMAGLVAAAVFTFLFGFSSPYIIASFMLAMLSVWRHRGNIERIMAGTEAKVK